MKTAARRDAELAGLYTRIGSAASSACQNTSSVSGVRGKPAQRTAARWARANTLAGKVITFAGRATVLGLPIVCSRNVDHLLSASPCPAAAVPGWRRWRARGAPAGRRRGCATPVRTAADPPPTRAPAVAELWRVQTTAARRPGRTVPAPRKPLAAREGRDQPVPAPPVRFPRGRWA